MNEELETGQEQPQQSGIQTFDAPKIRGQKAQFGRSFVDLSIPKNRDTMWDEYRTWWKMKASDERNQLENKWYSTYYGMDTLEYKEAKRKAIQNDYWNSPLQRLQNIFKTNVAVAQGGVDFIGDAAATIIPPYRKVDDWYDKVTADEDPIYQNIRSFSSIILPALLSGGAISARQALLKTPTTKLGHIGRFFQTSGLNVSADMAIIALSDHKFGPNLPQQLAESFPGMWGPEGRYPIPEVAKTMDSDSLTVRTFKHMLTDGGLSALASGLGATVDALGNHQVMGWFKPKDTAAKIYKQTEILKEADPALVREIRKLQVELNEGLAAGKIDRAGEQEYIDQIMTLEDRLKNPDTGGELIRKDLNRKDREEAISAMRKVDKLEPEQLELGFDPDLTPGVVSDKANPRYVPPAGNVARNKADVAALKAGISDGPPAPIITEAARTKGLQLGPGSRNVVLGIAEAARDAGDFDAIVDMVRLSSKDMDALALGLYEDIINADSIEDIVKMMETDRSIFRITSDLAISTLNETQMSAASKAIRYLFDKFLGADINASSARVMQTLGKEISGIGDSLKTIPDLIDVNKIQAESAEKLEFLLNEFALNKYLSGWILKMKQQWFKNLTAETMQEAAESLTKEFESIELAIRRKNADFRRRLEDAIINQPQFIRPLIEAFVQTNGRVDSIARLAKWADDQLTPVGLIRSPDPKEMNLFARGLITNVQNSWLSGKAPLNALKSGVSQLILHPITSIVGHGLTGSGKEWHGLKQAMYMNGAVFETMRRSFNRAYTMMLKSWDNPNIISKTYRKDVLVKDEKRWAILDGMVEGWEAENNVGKLWLYHLSKNLQNWGQNPIFRIGKTGLVLPDYLAGNEMAHYLSRLQSYTDVFEEFGYFDLAKAQDAEIAHWNNFWNKDETMKDPVLKALTGEINMNLDDGLANWINKATTAYPVSKFIMMFPRTQSNNMRLLTSWTPLSLIPNFNRYAKTIYAKTADEIAEVLTLHNIDPNHPYAQAIFEDFKARYVGRQAVSAGLVALLWGKAIAGDVIGNLHYNPARRARERQMGAVPTSVCFGEVCFSVEGTPLAPIVNILGDLAANMKDLDEATLSNFLEKLTWTMTATFVEGSPLQGFKPLTSIINGDWTELKTWLAGAGRGLVPLSGALGVLTQAIDSTLKDLEGEVHEHFMNRMPLLNMLLPDQIDTWTGQGINDIRHPVLRYLNAILPVKISQKMEPWRQWYLETGHTGMTRTKKSLDGTHTWTSAEREALHRHMGKYQGWKELERLSKNPKYNDLLARLRTLRHNNADIDNSEVIMKTSLLPLYRELDAIVDRLRRLAEYDLINDPEFAYLRTKMTGQHLTDEAMRQGDLPKAMRIQKQTENLIQMRK